MFLINVIIYLKRLKIDVLTNMTTNTRQMITIMVVLTMLLLMIMIMMTMVMILLLMPLLLMMIITKDDDGDGYKDDYADSDYGSSYVLSLEAASDDDECDYDDGDICVCYYAEEENKEVHQ